MGVFAPFVGLFGQSDVMGICGLVGIAGFILLADVRVRRGEAIATPAPIDRG